MLVEIEAEWKAGMTSTFAGPVSRQNGYWLAISSRLSATSADISPSYSKSTRIPSRMRTASWTFSARSALRVAEGREGEQRHAGLVAEPARDAGGLDGDLGELLRGGHLVDRRVGDEHRAAAGEADGDADHPVAGLGVDDAQHVAERDRGSCGSTPVTMASASPSATMEAAKWLRSWLIRRWQSRNRKPWRCRRS